MNLYQSTALFRPTMIRMGAVIAATLDGSSSDSGWYRMLPDGVTAARPEQNQLRLDNLRADIAGVNLVGWQVFIANDGYIQNRRIVDIDGTVITVKPEFDLGDVDDPLPETDIRYILVPNLLNPFNIYFDEDGSDELEIAYSTSFIAPGATGYSRELVSGETASPVLINAAVLKPDTSLELPTIHLHDLFYRFTTPSDTNKIRWGEYLIR